MKDIILKWIGEDLEGNPKKLTYVAGVIDGDNSVRDNLRERIPELEKAILEEISKEIMELSKDKDMPYQKKSGIYECYDLINSLTSKDI